MSHHFRNQSEVKPKPITTCSHAFSRAWRRRHVFTSSSNRFIGLSASVVIGQSNYFGFGFTTHSIENRFIYNLCYSTDWREVCHGKISINFSFLCLQTEPNVTIMNAPRARKNETYIFPLETEQAKFL